ncbi:MAG: cysteine dioxygenase type [Herbaspirillum sp.]|nr:cysteine dioxygenase type [Herbaspirillum sp.]
MRIANETAAFSTHPLREFIIAFSALLDRKPHEAAIFEHGGALLRTLIASDHWLPQEYAEPDPAYYRQFLLHADSGERFSVVSFVWGPGQRTPVHDHTVWGMIGMLRGAEYTQPYKLDEAGRAVPNGAAIRLEAGQVELLSPGVGDIHRVNNAYDDRVSISIHVYGANIGAVTRSVFTGEGERKPFISGYNNKHLPNIWDMSGRSR